MDTVKQNENWKFATYMPNDFFVLFSVLLKFVHCCIVWRDGRPTYHAAVQHASISNVVGSASFKQWWVTWHLFFSEPTSLLGILNNCSDDEMHNMKEKRRSNKQKKTNDMMKDAVKTKWKLEFATYMPNDIVFCFGCCNSDDEMYIAYERKEAKKQQTKHDMMMDSEPKWKLSVCLVWTSSLCFDCSQLIIITGAPSAEEIMQRNDGNGAAATKAGIEGKKP